MTAMHKPQDSDPSNEEDYISDDHCLDILNGKIDWPQRTVTEIASTESKMLDTLQLVLEC